MQCAECGSENREGVKFCEECGNHLDLRCPQCANVVLPDKKFCGQCGHRLSFSSKSPAVDYQQPRSYTPRFMAEKILTSRSSLEGEHKLVTVFFSDVAGFTSLSEKLDPEDIHRIMDGCFKIMMDVIHRYEGTINQFTGDGVMALFGAPLAHEDHARRACFAALDIQKKLGLYGEKIKAAYGLDFKMRIGLNSGPVVVGAIGDDLRMDYTAIGDTTNLAARMEGMATPGKILLSRNTYRLVRNYFHTAFQGKLSVKGKRASQEVYELLGHGSAESRLDASKARGLTSFVGREPEMKILLDAFERAREKSGQAIGIIGEAGVGKSRLILEMKGLVGNDCTWLKGCCLQYENPPPYHPLLDMLRDYFSIEKDQSESLAKDKIQRICQSLESGWKDSHSVFHDLFSLPLEDKVWEKLDPKEKQLRTFETLKSLFFKLSQKKSLVFVIDDLHWVDRTTEAFLEYFMGSIGAANILLLLVFRPAYSPPWSNKPHYNRISLEHLSAEKSMELIKAMLGEQVLSNTLNKLILSRASGNPLFLEELTYALIEEQILIRRDKGYVLEGPLAELEVPDSIQGIIAARIDRLEDSLKHILQTASVIGPNFAFRILEVISGLTTELKASLHDLQRLEFIIEKGMFPELEYLFTHTLTQEVAYNSLLKSRRQELHGQIGRAIEDVHAGYLENYFEVLAYHYSKSKNREKAFRYFILAGKKATEKNATWDALDFFKRGLALLGRQEQDHDNKRKHLEILHLMLSPIIVNGFPDAYISYIKDGVLLSKELGDMKSLVRFYSNLGLFYSTRGKYEKGVSYSAKAYEKAKKIGDLELMAQCAPDLSQVRFAQGSYQEVLALSSTMVQLIEGAHSEEESFGGPANVYAAFLGARGYAQALLGKFEEAFADCQKGIEHCRRIHNIATEGLSLCYYGLAQLQRGHGTQAREAFLDAIKALEEASFVLPLAWSWTGLGFAHTLLEEQEQGVMYIERGLKIHEDTGVKWERSLHFFYLAASHFLQGNLQKAKQLFRETLQSAREHHEIHMEGRAHVWLGNLFTDDHAFQKAEKHLTEGLNILHRLGTRPDEALGCYFFSKHYRLRGDQEASDEKRQIALKMIYDMKLYMDWILPHLEA